MLASVQGLPSLTILSTIDVDFDLEIQDPDGLSKGLEIGVDCHLVLCNELRQLLQN